MFFDRLNKWRSRGTGELVAAGVIYGALYLKDALYPVQAITVTL